MQQKLTHQMQEMMKKRKFSHRTSYTLQILALLDETAAAATITDGFNDNGIDALFFDRRNKELWLLI